MYPLCFCLILCVIHAFHRRLAVLPIPHCGVIFPPSIQTIWMPDMTHRRITN